MFATQTAWRRSRLGWGLLTALAWYSLLGCEASAPKAKALPVEGVLKWEKGPMVTELEGGSLEFEKEGAVAATAGITGDGTFTLGKALPPGTYRVRVVPPANPTRKGAEMDPRLQSFDTSGLTFTPTAETNQVTLELKKRGR